MNRRTFLKMIGIFTGGLILSENIPIFDTICSSIQIPDDSTWFGSMRELHQPYNGKMLIRYDVWAPELYKQYGIDIHVPFDIRSLDEFNTRYKNPAMSALRDALNQDGIKVSDLKPIPIPNEFLNLGMVGHGLNLS